MFCIVISIGQRSWGNDDIIMWKFVRMKHTVQHIYLIPKILLCGGPTDCLWIEFPEWWGWILCFLPKDENAKPGRLCDVLCCNVPLGGDYVSPSTRWKFVRTNHTINHIHLNQKMTSYVMASRLCIYKIPQWFAQYIVPMRNLPSPMFVLVLWIILVGRVIIWGRWRQVWGVQSCWS